MGKLFDNWYINSLYVCLWCWITNSMVDYLWNISDKGLNFFLLITQIYFYLLFNLVSFNCSHNCCIYIILFFIFNFNFLSFFSTSFVLFINFFFNFIIIYNLFNFYICFNFSLLVYHLVIYRLLLLVLLQQLQFAFYFQVVYFYLYIN